MSSNAKQLAAESTPSGDSREAQLAGVGPREKLKNVTTIAEPQSGEAQVAGVGLRDI